MEIMRGRSRRAESSAHNTIACETCRSKKRRCDRALPFCMQCAHDPSHCHYPEQNKRGLPMGYVNKIEARLADTEAALFHALSETRGGNQEVPPAFTPSSYTGQNKVDRVVEWDHLPLRSAPQMDAWYQFKLRGPEGGERSTSPSATTSSAATSQRRTRRADVRRRLPRAQNAECVGEQAAQAPDEGAVYSPPAAAVQIDGVAGMDAMNAEPSQAQQLSQAQGNMYF